MHIGTAHSEVRPSKMVRSKKHAVRREGKAPSEPCHWRCVVRTPSCWAGQTHGGLPQTAQSRHVILEGVSEGSRGVRSSGTPGTRPPTHSQKPGRGSRGVGGGRVENRDRADLTPAVRIVGERDDWSEFRQTNAATPDQYLAVRRTKLDSSGRELDCRCEWDTLTSGERGFPCHWLPEWRVL